MHKKAQGLSLNTVVIAAIVLIVLVILVAIVMGAIRNFSDDYDSIREMSCPEDNWKHECDPDREKEVWGNFEDQKQGQTCCRKATCEELGGKCLASCSPSNACVPRRIYAGDHSCSGLCYTK